MDFDLQPGTPAAGAAGTLPPPAPAAHPKADMTERLRTYVGPRWDSHYRHAFERLLKAQRGGASAPWTWNWAALFPAWFLYRRLYPAFTALVVARLFLWPFMIAGPDGNVRLMAPMLYLLMIPLQAWIADRLLFDKAVAAVGEIKDPERLARAGRPMMWPIWVPAMLAFHLFAPAVSYFLFYYRPEPAPKPVVTTPPPPPAREVRSADGRFALTVPYHWRAVDGLRDGAGIQAGSRTADHYLVVLTESRGDGSRGEAADRRVRAEVERLRERVEVESASDPRRIVVGPRPATRIEVIGTENGRRMMYFVTSVEDGESLHTVMAWTPITGADSTRTTYRHVLHSLREYGQ